MRLLVSMRRKFMAQCERAKAAMLPAPRLPVQQPQAQLVVMGQAPLVSAGAGAGEVAAEVVGSFAPT